MKEMVKVRLNRWRVRFQLRLPGPFVLARARLRSATSCARSSAEPSSVAGWVALILLSFAGAQIWRRRKHVNFRKARWIPAWKISLVIFGIIVILVILL